MLSIENSKAIYIGVNGEQVKIFDKDDDRYTNDFLIEYAVNEFDKLLTLFIANGLLG